MLKFLFSLAAALVLSLNPALAQLAINDGGTGSFTAGSALNNLGVSSATTYAVLAAAVTCNAANKGAFQPITDSTVITYNATISVGGGTYAVLAFCNGTNWTAH